MFFCGLSATLVAFRLGALPALVRRSSGVVGGGRAIRGSSFRFPFPFRASRRAPGGKVRSWWAPREPSRAGGLGRVAGVRLARWRRANRGPVTVVRGPPGGGGFRGRAGRRGLGRRGFPRRRVSFALFARKSKLTNSVVFASFLIRRGPHALYRKTVFRPRTAALFSRRRGPFLPRRGPFSGPPPRPRARRPGPAPAAPRTRFRTLLCRSPTCAVNFRALLCRSPTSVVGFSTLLCRSPTGVVGFSPLLCRSPAARAQGDLGSLGSSPKGPRAPLAQIFAKFGPGGI